MIMGPESTVLEKHALGCAFHLEKHKVARAGGIVKFWLF